MTIKEFYDRLYKINKNLTIVRKTVPVRIFFSDHDGNADIYDFETGEYNLPSCDKYLSNDMEDVADLIDAYNYDSKYEDWVNNPFRLYTKNLAETLQEKNKAYGDSFSQSVDDYGLKVIGIRLSDKYNRIKHLVNNGELKENDESLADTLLDMAGYAILGLKYLEEHKK
ncbi:hypothetical protein IMAU20067_00700 [Lactobacillus helveticus]|uniref:nucleotide modification associated domain-containing protein n=1 Tax=Lactobacillus helveticus TaxID=1587 RepID=UPI0019F94B3A|nr:nucleotide modification associated domain-containing protein [Lactobacillus helveticus]NRO73866.1 hypothetical protein [Lactobacillus helveticus]